jgi:OmpA-OmpF porin, OOP family
MLRPSRIHHKKDDSFAKFQQWAFFIKNAGDLLSALAKIGLFLGILNIFLYIWKIGFMPSGLSLSDGIIFVFTFLAVSFISVVGAIYGFISLFWIYYLTDGLKNKEWLRKKKVNFQATSQLPRWAQSAWWAIISGLIFLYFTISLLSIWLNSETINDSTVFFLYSILVAGTLLSLVILTQNNLNYKRISRSEKFLMLALIPVVILVFSKGEIFSIAMKIIGVRYENVSIETTSENIIRVRSLAKAYGLNIAACPLVGIDHHLILNVNILWTGIGNRTLAEMASQTFVEKDTHKKFIYVQFDNSTIWPVYAKKENNPPNRANLNKTHCSS